MKDYQLPTHFSPEDDVEEIMELAIDRMSRHLDGNNPLADNYRRAYFAAAGLTGYQRVAGTEDILETVITDFLQDLRHLCDFAGADFEELAAHTRDYEADLKGEF